MMGTTAVEANYVGNNKHVEMQQLVGTYNDLEQGKSASGQAVPLKAGAKAPPSTSLSERLICQLNERHNVKLLMRLWGPRLEFVVRLMIVCNFFEDSLSTLTHFSEHATQVGQQGYVLKWIAGTYPGFAQVIATLALTIGVLAQLCGSGCLLALVQPDIATKVLIGWVIAQPLLYAQLANFEFIAESLSILGGLLMLRAHIVFDRARNSGGNRVQLVGRLLLPSAYMYYMGQFLCSAITLDETNGFVSYMSSLSMFFINGILLVGLVIGSALVAAGLKSRVMAMLLAILNLVFVFYQHPFFNMITLEGGHWKYIEDNMSMPHVVLPSDVLPNDLDPEQIYNLHRYYFYMGISTSGALLLLAQFGPGEIAVQKDEVILPVRAQD
jgi:uncharacterized membrane protein YphA (DoxX/SURF4 family)